MLDECNSEERISCPGAKIEESILSHKNQKSKNQY